MTDPADGTAVMWRGGWYRYARSLASPNFGARPAGALIDLIVVHSISLPPGEYGGGQVQQLFCNQLDWNAHPYFKSIEGMKVSAHFYIRRTGELWQFVSCDDRAWHAGQSSYRGRGDCNDDSVGIELEGLEGGDFEAPQYEALAALCAAIAQKYPICHIAGHEHIAPGRKADPGERMDWRGLQGALAWPPGHFPAGVFAVHK
ncbi:MAG: 1,6-anhydro-N-acetylmuramyl-L-alanine amidase AmpD [Burkholderiales bacterium]|nr:1,6-anhydro-N-acetylmuramyl-L-alanine amidase AmpD [Burkholderiales bacterium]